MTTNHPDAGWLSRIAASLASYLEHPEWLGSPTSSVTGGGAIQAAEDRFAELVGTAHAILMPSATYAMRAALMAVGVRLGDEVIVPKLDWCANWAAVEAIGARPVPANVTPSTLTLDPDAAARAITSKAKAVIATHAHGVPADIEAVTSATGLPVVEDLSGALGATLRGSPVGGLGAVGVLSLGPGKEIDCGEGAVVFTNSDCLWELLIAATAHPVRQTLSGLERPAFGQFSIRAHPLAAVLALTGLEQWDAANLHERSLAALTAIEDAGLRPLAGGKERQLATAWIPIRLDAGSCPSGFMARSSGARFVDADGGFAPATGIRLVTPA